MNTTFKGRCTLCGYKVQYTIEAGASTLFPKTHNRFKIDSDCGGKLEWLEAEPGPAPLREEPAKLAQIERELESNSAWRAEVEKRIKALEIVVLKPKKLHGSRAEVIVCDDVKGEPHERHTWDIINRVQAERKKQKLKWGIKHDDTHEHAELARAATCTALGDNKIYDRIGSSIWPGGWDFRERGKVERLIVACALLIAEIERIERYQNDPPA